MSDIYDLGTDIRVLPDLDEDETLVEGVDCYAQDVLLRLDNPRGLADGTDEGAAWGYDLAGNVNESLTPRGVLQIVVDTEVQIEADERTDSCKASATFDPITQALAITLDCQIGDAPHSLTLELSATTLGLVIPGAGGEAIEEAIVIIPVGAAAAPLSRLTPVRLGGPGVVSVGPSEADVTAFVGFAIGSYTEGQSVSVFAPGRVPGFSGLTPGVEYWLYAAGIVTYGSLPPGTWTRTVGTPLSSTDLMFNLGPVLQVP